MPPAASLLASDVVRSNCSRDRRLAARKPWPPIASTSCQIPACRSSGSVASICRMPWSAPMSVADRVQNPCGSGWCSSDGTNVSQIARRTSTCAGVGSTAAIAATLLRVEERAPSLFFLLLVRVRRRGRQELGRAVDVPVAEEPVGQDQVVAGLDVGEGDALGRVRARALAEQVALGAVLVARVDVQIDVLERVVAADVLPRAGDVDL